jgi:serine/threonine-protein kinase
VASVNDSDERRLQVVWSDAKGSVEDAGLPPDAYLFPQLSPDNTHLALTRLVGKNLEVWMSDLVRGGFSRFAYEGTLNHIPVWTPDGRRVLYSSDRDGAANLYWQLADGSGTAERLTTSAEHQDPGSFSADGKLLAYASQSVTTDWDIWVLPLDGRRQPRVYKQTPNAEHHPMISPNGRWLAYTSDESGTPAVYVEAFPGGGSKKQISTSGGISSLWSHDGRQLFYCVNSDALMVVDVQEGASSFVAGRPRLAISKVLAGMTGFGTPGFSLGRDRRWLFLTPRETLHARIDVVRHALQ